MFPLFETICIKDGVSQNMDYHKERFHRAYHTYYQQSPLYEFAHKLIVRDEYQEGTCKLKILYNRTDQIIIIDHYEPRKVKSLKLVVDNTINYELKYADRSRIEHLFQLKKDNDDILIVKKGLITDTSICNVVFFDGSQWITPLQPLLKGTMRQKLLNDKTIVERNITVKEIHTFRSFKLINAMKDFKTEKEIPVRNIKE